jgi:NAD(P)-dependent dehydrogenase (short-subunit alcohol dehydrogenase family)
MRLESKVAFVTGAGMGVGRAICLLFAHEGSRIVAADINQEAGMETVRLVEERDDQTRQAISDWVPLGRLGTAEDIAYCALFLASEESA